MNSSITNLRHNTHSPLHFISKITQSQVDFIHVHVHEILTKQSLSKE